MGRQQREPNKHFTLCSSTPQYNTIWPSTASEILKMRNEIESPILNYLLTNEPTFRKARLGALYSDFRQLQTTNPDGYYANIQSWRKALAHASRAGILPSPSCSLLTISVDEPLLRELESRDNGRPLALGTVVQESVQAKEMLGFAEFMGARESIYTKRWELSPWSMFGWGLRQLGLIGRGTVVQGKVVVLANLEECGTGFGQRVGGIKSRVERIYSRRAFEEEFGNLLGEIALSKGDFEILLRYLSRDKELLVYDGETVKLLAAGEETIITQEDRTIASLKTLIVDLETQIKILEKRVETLGKQAKEAVERKNRVSALSALRSKKLAETTLGKRHTTLAQLEEVFTKIEQAADQVEIVRIMEGSAKVLAGLNKQVGGVERVDEVVDQLREQMGQVNEVGDVLAEQGREGIDESEVDEELMAMERVEREKQEAEERQVKEEQERKEAEATRNKLAALDEVGLTAPGNNNTMQKENPQNAADAKKADAFEKNINKSVEDLKRMQLEPAEEQTA